MVRQEPEEEYGLDELEAVLDDEAQVSDDSEVEVLVEEGPLDHDND